MGKVRGEDDVQEKRNREVEGSMSLEQYHCPENRRGQWGRQRNRVQREETRMSGGSSSSREQILSIQHCGEGQWPQPSHTSHFPNRYQHTYERIHLK